MNVMMVGSGGREHALAWRLTQDGIDNLYITPGNAGTDTLGENVPIEATDVPGLVNFARQNRIDLTVIGPDDALAVGLADELQKAGLAAFGPVKAAASIETSKAYAKDLMRRQNIPTADFRTFTNPGTALAYIHNQSYPLVVKADGLALGKGVRMCHDANEAEQAVTDLMVRQVHGGAGNQIIIEQYLDGPEVSLHALSDGRTYAMFPAAQDHKTIREGNQGPMTGGMGTVAPLPWLDREQLAQLGEQIVGPALDGIEEASTRYKGLLYPGLKMDSQSGANVLEYNARFGDPETQVYMRLLQGSLLKTLIACVDGNLAEAMPQWSDQSAVCVVLASPGYPETSTKDLVIEGLEEAAKQPGIEIFHAGTTRKDGNVVTNGGRVLGITAVGASIAEAATTAYSVIDNHINFDGMQFRRDIGEYATQQPRGIL